MSLDWFHNIPWVTAALLTVAFFVIVAVGGLLASRRLVLRLWKDHPEPPNDIVGFFFGAVGVFYGIALGLIAVAAWQNWSEVDNRVKEEGALVRALRSDTRSFPHPLNERLPGYLHMYLEFEKDTAWKYHQLGLKSPRPDTAIRKFHECLYAFEPRTAGESNLQAEAMRRWNDVLRLRSIRNFSAESHGLSTVVWFVVVMGALLNIAVTWMFVITPRRGHVALSAMVATMIGLLIFLLVAMDQPFRGGLAVKKEPFELADRAAHESEKGDHPAVGAGELCHVPTLEEKDAP